MPAFISIRTEVSSVYPKEVADESVEPLKEVADFRLLTVMNR